MSWNWRENEEKEEKEYEVEGTVTISTKEYKDLIMQVAELRAAGQREHDDWYKELNRANDLEKELKETKKELSELNAWMDCDDRPNENLRFLFRQWKIKKLEE